MPDASSRPTLPLAVALRASFARGYDAAQLKADVLAGIVVGVVALPLSMALAIAVGVAPQHGLYTAIVAGAAVALLGGSRFQVTGPTAAFVVILAPIVTRHGLTGLLTAGFMAGLMLVAMGLGRLGRLIQYIPHPVTTGFTAGIATVIATLQLKDAFGLRVTLPEHYLGKLVALARALPTARPAELAVSAATLALLAWLPRLIKRVPAPLLALGLMSALVALAHHLYPSFAVATIGSRFHATVNGVDIAGIPSALPRPAAPWSGQPLSFALVQALAPAAFAIAMLGAIESLLSAVVADGMTRTRHDPNAELVALGIGNLLAPLFGGIAATGALARTATNIRSGARSPLAAATHALVVLLSILALAPLVAYVPMAALAALLLRVAWNMSELHHFVEIVKIAPKSDVTVLLTCYTLTVLFDMVVAVSVGVVLAAILFMRRMAELTDARVQLESDADEEEVPLPSGVLLYEIAGSLFFGAAQEAMAALHRTRGQPSLVVVLDLGKVAVIDATGFVALESAIDSVLRDGKRVILAGPLPRPRRIFERADLERRHAGLTIAPDLASAMASARGLVEETRRTRVAAT